MQTREVPEVASNVIGALVLENKHVIKIHPKQSPRQEKLNAFFTLERIQLGRLVTLAAVSRF